MARSKADVLTDQAAALAFWTFLSIFPVAIAFVSLLGTMEVFIGEANADKVRNEVTERLDRVLAVGQMDSIRTTILDILTTPRAGLAIIALLTALWSMSKGFAGLCRSLAHVHGRSYARVGIIGRAHGLALGGGTLLLLTLALMQFVLGPTFGLGGREVTSSVVTLVWSLLRVPVLVGLGLLWLTVVLKVGPGLPGRLRLFVPGAAAAATMIGLLVAGSVLIVRLGLFNANPLLGALGGVILLMSVLNLLARAILMGAEVNDVRFRPERSGLAVPVAGGAEEVRVDGRQDG
jgi:membrane protein